MSFCYPFNIYRRFCSLKSATSDQLHPGSQYIESLSNSFSVDNGPCRRRGFVYVLIEENEYKQLSVLRGMQGFHYTVKLWQSSEVELNQHFCIRYSKMLLFRIEQHEMKSYKNCFFLWVINLNIFKNSLYIFILDREKLFEIYIVFK